MLSSTPRWPDVETAELVVCTMEQTIPPSTVLEVHTHCACVSYVSTLAYSRRIMRQTVMLYG